jgi:DNA-binding CsgD family transcriptional regulator
MSEVMVGRVEELRQLCLLVDGGVPAVAILAGEAGIGKTRLVQELIAAQPASMPILSGQADPGTLSRPFELLLDAVDGYCTQAAEPDDELLETVSDTGRGMVERLQAGLEIVRSLTTPGPAIVVFEDLHWADSESVALFERIADLPGPRLLIGTYRPDEVTRRHPVAELLPHLERRHTVAHLRIDRLNLTETSAFLRETVGTTPSYRTVVALHNRTGGNPFFLEELLKARGDADIEDICDQPLPWNVAEALRRQLDDLAPDEQRIAEAAAVLGRKVPFDLLAAVTDVGEDALIGALRDLVSRGLMVELGEDEFSFRHALTREALLDQMLGRQRRRLHEIALDTLLATGSKDYALVAHHARRAGRYAEMIEADRRGLASYLKMGSPYQALQLAEMGLDRLPDDVELLAGAARSAWLAGLLDDAEDAARRWLAAAGPVGAAAGFTGAGPAGGADGAAGAAAGGAVSAVGAAASGAVGAAAGGAVSAVGVAAGGAVSATGGGATGAAGRADALRLLVRLAWETGRIADMRDLTDQLEEESERLPEGAAQARAFAAIAQSAMLRDETDEAVAWADRAIAAGEALGLPDVWLAGKVEKGSALACVAASVQDGVKLLTEVAEQAEDAHEWLLAARALNNILDSGLLPGTLADWFALLERMRRDAERAGFDALSTAAYFQSRARLAVQDGDLRLAIGALEDGRRRDIGLLRTRRGTDYHGVFLAGLLLEAGELDKCQAVLHGLYEQPTTAKATANWAQTGVPGLAFHLACRLGDRAEALKQLDAVYAAVAVTGVVARDYVHDLVSAGLSIGIPVERLAPLAEKIDPERTEPEWRWLVEGQLAEAAGRWDEALEKYRDAARNGAVLLPAPRGTANVGAARALITLGRLDEARAHAETAGHLLARWVGWRVTDLAAVRSRLGLGAALADDAAVALTPREREVAQLLAEGLTNAELARRLFISPRTAAVHVSNILSKLGVTSRTQVASRLHEATHR